MTTKSWGIVGEANRPYWSGVGKILCFHNPTSMCSGRLRLVSVRAIFIENVSHLLLQSARLVGVLMVLPTDTFPFVNSSLLFFPARSALRTSLHRQLEPQQVLWRLPPSPQSRVPLV